ncbi:hypothetical protein [Piscinibacter koreensis]|uniref:Uncharacterized protein n=1 Tax=Piscinibacter koreensis TaxID=2742824 RepID=A0A7Y6NSD8_9BURK|nr:hypothetical protein [Schlegelella koreensis]NUZ08416.1 hypothetical protein [Schlegelella koreensis]NUZ08456.1 hypothetical protein [Schlegelella koreensis]
MDSMMSAGGMAVMMGGMGFVLVAHGRGARARDCCSHQTNLLFDKHNKD